MINENETRTAIDQEKQKEKPMTFSMGDVEEDIDNLELIEHEMTKSLEDRLISEFWKVRKVAYRDLMLEIIDKEGKEN
jgi:tetrahydromethanopterin S-methyltransferase subunit B